jgi:hypothetical protein
LSSDKLTVPLRHWPNWQRFGAPEHHRYVRFLDCKVAEDRARRPSGQAPECG